MIVNKSQSVIKKLGRLVQNVWNYQQSKSRFLANILEFIQICHKTQ